MAHFIADPQPARGNWDFAQTSLRTVITQPRRIAARAAAHRLADLTGTRVGELAGYTVRGQRKISAATRCEFVTPGVLLRRLLADPGLDGIGAVVADEVHERSLDSDLLLGMLVELRSLRPDLALVAMSATVDAAAFAELLGRADESGPVPVLTSPATPHHLQIHYRPAPGPRQDARGVTAEFIEHLARTTAAVLGEHPGDALVFLPGAREIAATITALEPLVPAGTQVLPLHGSLEARAQDAALRPDPHGRRRVVVSSAVAESSLTVPGVRIVVDSCLAREPRLDVARGVQGLVTVACSQDAATQRAGRAARTADGVAVRAIAAADWPRLRPHRTPEIATADLTGALLDLACWGTPRGTGLPLLTPVPPAPADRAESTLRSLSLVDDRGAVTPSGRLVATVPVDPRHGRALLATGASAVAAETVAALSEPPRRADACLPEALAELRSGTDPAARRFREEAQRLQQLAVRAMEDAAPDVIQQCHTAAPGGGRWDDPAHVAALAVPEWIARRTAAADPAARGRARGAEYKLAAGSRVRLPAGSPLATAEWLAVAALDRVGDDLLVRLGAELDPEAALSLAGDLLVEDETVSYNGVRISARTVRRVGAIEVSATPSRASAAAARAAVRDWIHAQGDSGADAAAAPGADWFERLTGTDSTVAVLRRRLALLHRTLGAPWPEVDAAALAAATASELAPLVDALATGGGADSVDLASLLRAMVPWPEAGRIDELAPERLTLPSGNAHRLRYPAAAEAPVLAAKLQEFFGLATSPRIASGRVPVTVELLSPAGRPLAVSGDLEFFWNEVYPGVRAEMRGRYPKHPWPDNPWDAPATAKTNRALRRR